MSYAKRQMWAALDALGVAAEEEGYPFEAMEDDPHREAAACDKCGAPDAEAKGDGRECGAPGLQGRCSCAERKEAD